MAADAATLPLTSYAILGLLDATEEYTAVEIQARAYDFIRFFYWTPALSHIRRELDRLDELGFVTAREVRQGRVKHTLKYRVTEAGETNLRRWAGNGPYEPPVVKNSMLLRLWLGRRAGDKEGVLRLLEANIERIRSERKELMELIESTVDESQRPDQAESAWTVEVMRHTLRTFDHNLESSAQLLEELRRRDLI